MHSSFSRIRYGQTQTSMKSSPIRKSLTDSQCSSVTGVDMVVKHHPIPSQPSPSNSPPNDFCKIKSCNGSQLSPDTPVPRLEDFNPLVKPHDIPNPKRHRAPRRDRLNAIAVSAAHIAILAVFVFLVTLLVAEIVMKVMHQPMRTEHRRVPASRSRLRCVRRLAVVGVGQACLRPLSAFGIACSGKIEAKVQVRADRIRVGLEGGEELAGYLDLEFFVAHVLVGVEAVFVVVFHPVHHGRDTSVGYNLKAPVADANIAELHLRPERDYVDDLQGCLAAAEAPLGVGLEKACDEWKVEGSQGRDVWEALEEGVLRRGIS